MSTKARLENELNRIAPLIAAGGALQALTMDIAEGRLVIELVAVDALSCAFERFQLETDKLSGASVEDLKQVADDLSNRLSYLLEKISPVEIYREECLVQMRSSPPQKDDDGTKYYELVVNREALTLCRFGKTSGQPRRLVPAHVTREVLARLADDFSAAVA